MEFWQTVAVGEWRQTCSIRSFRQEREAAGGGGAVVLALSFYNIPERRNAKLLMETPTCIIATTLVHLY